MTDAPERIWVWPCDPDLHNDSIDDGGWIYGSWDRARADPGFGAEYTRSDLIPQWQPISTAPRDGSDVVCYAEPHLIGGGIILLCWMEYKGVAAWWDFEMEAWNPTHWMPIPEAPK